MWISWVSQEISCGFHEFYMDFIGDLHRYTVYGIQVYSILVYFLNRTSSNKTDISQHLLLCLHSFMAFLYASPGFRNSSSPWAKLQESPPKFKIGAASSLNMGPGHPKQESHPASLPTKRFHREKMSCSHVRLNKHQHSMLFLLAVSGHQLYSYQATCTGKLFQEVPSAKPQLCVELSRGWRGEGVSQCGVRRVCSVFWKKITTLQGTIIYPTFAKQNLSSECLKKKYDNFRKKCILVGSVRVSFSGSPYHPGIKNLIPSLELT